MNQKLLYSALVIFCLSLIGAWFYKKSGQVPTLEVAGEMDVKPARTLIPLRTRSKVPVAVHQYRIRLRDESNPAKESAAVSEEKRSMVDLDLLHPGHWYNVEFQPLHVNPGETVTLPVKVWAATADGPRHVDVQLSYGDAKEPQVLSIDRVEVMPSARKVSGSGAKSGAGK